MILPQKNAVLDGQGAEDFVPGCPYNRRNAVLDGRRLTILREIIWKEIISEITGSNK